MSNGPSRDVAKDGLSNLAHAIRRSTALHTAVLISPEDTTDEQLLARADKFAKWLLGKAGEAEEQAGEQFLGERFPPVG